MGIAGEMISSLGETLRSKYSERWLIRSLYHVVGHQLWAPDAQSPAIRGYGRDVFETTGSIGTRLVRGHDSRDSWFRYSPMFSIA